MLKYFLKIKLKMNKIIKLIFFFVVVLFLNNCSDFKNVITNTKEQGGDEFLVIKKQPLSIPPDFDKIPVPVSEQNLEEIKEITLSENEIENLLKDISKENKTQSDNQVSEDLENSILKKIN
tara:strand:+ start:955 stop:1317 length:363 start_codon:yes stop_codon:yes gene_type:complete